MKVIHINHSDLNGGAARAAYRIHKALLIQNVKSRMWVNCSSSGDKTVEMPFNKIQKLISIINSHISHQFTKLLKTKNKIIHSPSIFSSHWVNIINNSDADIVHLHWFQHEMLSIADIAKIEKPIVWTLHDMWAFCGAEHYTTDKRWIKGYNKSNRPKYENGLDINLWTWHRKKNYWSSPLQIISPSRWLASCVKKSNLMKTWPVSVIPHPISEDKWKMLNKKNARKKLGLSKDNPILLFGAIGGVEDNRKGFDLLIKALNHLKKNKYFENLQLVVFGQKKNISMALPYPTHYMGHINDDLILSILYNAADAMIVPSRLEAFGQTALESSACGTPVIAFDVGGLSDIIEHKRTGYLADPFNIKDLSNGIIWTLGKRYNYEFKKNILKKIKKNFSEKQVANTYLKLYQSILRHKK